jgi:hypothetical protein
MIIYYKIFLFLYVMIGEQDQLYLSNINLHSFITLVLQI